MNRNRLLGILSIGLLVSNLALITFIFFGKKPPLHNGPRDIIIERLHFDEQQVAAYDKLISVHRSTIDEKQREMFRLKNELYHGLLKEQTLEKDSLEKAIGAVQAAIEETNYNHFSDIRKLCTQEQQAYFNELVNDIAELFRPMHPPRK
jgi:hypothetical protein